MDLKQPCPNTLVLKCIMEREILVAQKGGSAAAAQLPLTMGLHEAFWVGINCSIKRLL